MKAELINVILDKTGNMKGNDEITGNKQPLELETLELKRTLNYFIESLSGEGSGLKSSWLSKIKRTFQVYNIYGRSDKKI